MATPLVITYSGVERITLNTGFGKDQVEVHKTDPAVSNGYFINTFAGDDKITIGSSADAAQGLDDLSAKIFVNAGLPNNASGDWLYIDDSASKIGHKYEFSKDSTGGGWYGEIRRLDRPNAGVFYYETEQVTLWTGSGDDEVAVSATNKWVWNGGYQINTGAGNDKITIGTVADGLNNIASEWARIRVNAGADDDDALIIQDTTNPGQAYELGADSTGKGWDGLIKRADKPEIFHFGVEKVTLNTGAAVDNITITATHKCLGSA